MTDLRLDQHQIDEEHHEVVLDVFVREALAARTLRQPHAFAETAVVGFAVFVVEPLHGVAAFDADGHRCDYEFGSGSWLSEADGWIVLGHHVLGLRVQGCRFQ